MKSDEIKDTQNEEEKAVTLAQEQFEKLLDAIRKGNDEPQVEEKHCKCKCKSKIAKFMPLFLKILLGVVFICAGLLAVLEMSNNIENYWSGTYADGLAVVLTYIISFGIMGCGVSVFVEKDRKYIVSVASLFVAFVALMISLIK